MEIYASARRHGIDDLDIAHAVDHAIAAGEQDDGKALYLGPDRAGNLLEVVSVLRDDGAEIADPRDADAPHVRVVPSRTGRS